MEQKMRQMDPISATIGASKERVWDALTVPDQLAKWWAPQPFTTPFCDIEVESGGHIRIEMEAPDGSTFPMTGIYGDVDKPNRLVMISSPLDVEGNPICTMEQTFTLSEEGGQTKITAEAKVIMETPQAAPYIDGYPQGMTAALNQLAKLLK